jgi:succinylglutamic semialdehyde dehydrogenase
MGQTLINTLLAGNSAILKPSEKTSFTIQLLTDCFHKAGFPSGVVNLIHGSGDGEMTKRLLKEKSIKGVFFTGTTEIGKKIIELTHQDLSKMVSMSLSSKNITIIDKDSGNDQVLSEILKSSFKSSGQLCTSTKLVAIHESLHENFIDRFHEQTKKLVIDHPFTLEQAPFMGPLVSQQEVDNYILFMGMAKREGLDEVMRGKQLERRHKGYYVTPSIHFCEEFKPKSHFLISEILGPNCTFISYKEIEEVFAFLQKIDFSFITSLFTKNETLKQKCFEEIQTGVLNINQSSLNLLTQAPWTPLKNSGNARTLGGQLIRSCVQTMTYRTGGTN